MEFHPVAVPRQGDIAGVGVPSPVSPEHGSGPRPMPSPCGWSRHNRGRSVIILQVERDAAPVVGAHDMDRSLTCSISRAFRLHPSPRSFWQEHDAVPAGEIPRAALDRETQIIAELPPLASGRARPRLRACTFRIRMVRYATAIGRFLADRGPSPRSDFPRVIPCRSLCTMP